MLKLFQSMTEVPAGRRAIALGTFDGVHLGHRAVIAAARRSGERLAAVTCAATFHPRPATLLNPDVYPATLAGVTQRVRLLGEAGAEEVVLLRFNRALADLTAEAFVEQVIVEHLGAIAVTVGSDFRFGRDRSGDVALLGELCARHGVRRPLHRPENAPAGAVVWAVLVLPRPAGGAAFHVRVRVRGVHGRREALGRRGRHAHQ